MKKLGIKEQDLKKPEVHEDRGTHGGAPGFMDQFEGSLIEILKENNKTTKDIMSAQISYKSSITKDDIVIEWAPDSEEPDPTGPSSVPKVARAVENATMKKAA